MKKFYIFFTILLLFSCEKDSYLKLIKPDTKINLKWNKAYADDTIDKSLIGLKWALSYCGAVLPTSTNGFIVSENTITIDVKKLGFSEKALQKLLQLADKIKTTSEYQANNSIDLGRYVSLLIGASEHYYEITELPETLFEVINNYTLLPQKGYINNSGVSLEHRIIQFSEQNGFNQVFLSEEVSPTTGEIFEYETIELLPNGQLRFGIFDINGNRKPNADTSHSNAGKPAKCMWCNESTINPLYTLQNDYPGYLTESELQNTLIGFRDSHHILKINLQNGVDFTQTQQHTLTELLYISFMEPSAERLSYEWNMTVSEVETLLVNFSTHEYTEFPFLGQLYHRNEIESLAPFQGLQISTSVREESAIEVNHLQ